MTLIVWCVPIVILKLTPSFKIGIATMIRPRWWLVTPVLLASALFSATPAAEIRDKAKLFSPEAVKKAQAGIDRLEKEYDVPVTIETVESLDGEKIGKLLDRHAQAVNAQGVYILMTKEDHDLLVESSKHFRQFLPRSKMTAIERAFATDFRKGNFDAGLQDGVEKMDSVFSEAKSDAGGTIRQSDPPNVKRAGVAAPARQTPIRKNTSGGFSLIWLIVGGLAIFFVIRMIGAFLGAMRGNQYGPGGMGGRGGYPGPGGPGYGGGGYGGAPAGGGGFMSSLFGGIGGAMAGNYLYDQFSGRNHGGNVDQTSYDPAASAAAPEDTSPEWSSGNDAGTSWGDSAAPADNSGGGDWGGGGGDWGGGGDTGGGDWGGGGDDNGGSW